MTDIVAMRLALEALEHAYIVATECVEEDAIAEPLMLEVSAAITALNVRIAAAEETALAE